MVVSSPFRFVFVFAYVVSYFVISFLDVDGRYIFILRLLASFALMVLVKCRMIFLLPFRDIVFKFID